MVNLKNAALNFKKAEKGTARAGLFYFYHPNIILKRIEYLRKR